MNRNRYPVSVMCRFLGVPRSGYYDYVRHLDPPAHDAILTTIIRERQEKYGKNYGYSRIKWKQMGQQLHKWKSVDPRVSDQQTKS